MYKIITVLLLVLCITNAIEITYDHHSISVGEEKHTCIHDQLGVKFPVDLHVNNKQSVDSASMLGAAQATSHPFRIILNSTYLSASVEPQTCSSVGQVVTIGSPGSSTSTTCTNSQGAVPCLYTCTAADIMTTSFANALTDIVTTKVIDFFQNVLTIPGDPKTNYLPYLTISGNLPCTQQYIKMNPAWAIGGTGFNADLILFVTAHPIASSGTIAYAASCVLDNVNNYRPLVAFINLSPSRFSQFADPAKRVGAAWEMYYRVMLHEVTHGLGFSSDLYRYFRDSNNIVYPTTTKQINYTNVNGGGVSYSIARTFLTTPSVTSVARNHFQCSSLLGAELENVGGSGTAGSHWKGTVFGEEVMIGYAQSSAPYSNLTLSLLLDTGWYGMNQTNIQTLSEKLVWGAGFGCQFPETCNTTSWSGPGYFESNLNNYMTRRCSATRSGKGYTYIVQYNGVLPVPQQHFSNPSVGGAFNFKDYCPYSDVYPIDLSNNFFCFDTTQSANISTAIGEVLGPTSRCFEYLPNGANPASTTPSMACWQQQCANGTLQINYKGNWVNCTSGATRAMSDGLTILCPVAYNVCGESVIPPPANTGGSTTGYNSSNKITFSILVNVFMITIFTIFF